MVDFYIVIPARFASVRFPGKPLHRIAGQEMVLHTYQRACQSGAKEVWVATEDERIEQLIRAHGGRVQRTSSAHESGTSRVAEVAALQGWSDDTVVVNVQGDEPLMPGVYADRVAALVSAEVPMSSAYSPMLNESELHDPNVVKVVLDQQQRALYFSRSAIPYDRQQQWLSHALASTAWHRHLGIYGYTVDFLRRFCALSVSPLEQLESLEQLRALWHGYSIKMASVERSFPSVDVPDDVAHVEKVLAASVP